MSLDVAYLALGELERMLSQYDERLKGVEDTWKAFTESAAKTKSSWDSDLPRIKIRVDQLRNVVDSLKKEQEVLLAKRELGLISDKDYESLSAELQKRIYEYQEKLDALSRKAAEIEMRVLYLWARGLTKDYLAKFDLVGLEKKIEDARAAGRIDEETYAKMRHEIEVMKQTWELLNILSPIGNS